jgi:hypothetical protein
MGRGRGALHAAWRRTPLGRRSDRPNTDPACACACSSGEAHTALAGSASAAPTHSARSDPIIGITDP